MQARPGAAPPVAEPHGRRGVGGAREPVRPRRARPLRERAPGRHPRRVLARAGAPRRRRVGEPARRLSAGRAQPAAAVPQRVRQPLHRRRRGGRPPGARRTRRVGEQDQRGAAGAEAAHAIAPARPLPERDAREVPRRPASPRRCPFLERLLQQPVRRGERQRREEVRALVVHPRRQFFFSVLKRLPCAAQSASFTASAATRNKWWKEGPREQGKEHGNEDEKKEASGCGRRGDCVRGGVSHRPALLGRIRGVRGGEVQEQEARRQGGGGEEGAVGRQGRRRGGCGGGDSKGGIGRAGGALRAAAHGADARRPRRGHFWLRPRIPARGARRSQRRGVPRHSARRPAGRRARRGGRHGRGRRGRQPGRRSRGVPGTRAAPAPQHPSAPWILHCREGEAAAIRVHGEGRPPPVAARAARGAAGHGGHHRRRHLGGGGGQAVDIRLADPAPHRAGRRPGPGVPASRVGRVRPGRGARPPRPHQRAPQRRPGAPDIRLRAPRRRRRRGRRDAGGGRVRVRRPGAGADDGTGAVGRGVGELGARDHPRRQGAGHRGPPGARRRGGGAGDGGVPAGGVPVHGALAGQAADDAAGGGRAQGHPASCARRRWRCMIMLMHCQCAACELRACVRGLNCQPPAHAFARVHHTRQAFPCLPRTMCNSSDNFVAGNI